MDARSGRNDNEGFEPCAALALPCFAESFSSAEIAPAPDGYHIAVLRARRSGEGCPQCNEGQHDSNGGGPAKCRGKRALFQQVGGPVGGLQGVIEQAFFHTPGSIIEAENIKLPGDKTLERSWKYDKEAFIAAWKSAGGNISKLATMLDVSRVTLYRYLKKYGLGPKAK